MPFRKLHSSWCLPLLWLLLHGLLRCRGRTQLVQRFKESPLKKEEHVSADDLHCQRWETKSPVSTDPASTVQLYSRLCRFEEFVNEPAYPATNTASDAIALNELASQIIKFPGCLEPLWANLYADLVAHAELCSQQRKWKISFPPFSRYGTDEALLSVMSDVF